MDSTNLEKIVIEDSSLRVEKFLDNDVKVFRVSAGRDTSKEEVAVGKILAVQNRGVSDATYKRKGTGLYFPGIVKRRANVITQAYEIFAPNINKKTVVFGSANRTGLYLSRVLDAPFLPLQFISYTDNWQTVSNMKEPFIAGFDYCADPLIYVRFRPNELPREYKKFIDESENVVVCRSKDWTRAKKLGDGFVHGSAWYKHNRFKAPKPKLNTPEVRTNDWEWGLSDEIMGSVKDYCKKKGKNFLAVDYNTIYLFFFGTELVNTFYQKNNVKPKKFTFNSYYISHPYYEIETLSLPFCSYFANHPRKNAFIEKIQKETRVRDAEVFINNFGRDNVQEFQNYLSSRFNILKSCIGTDSWDDKNSSSRYIARKIKRITPKDWQFLTLDDVRGLMKRVRY